jgi:hypothetical protein
MFYDSIEAAVAASLRETKLLLVLVLPAGGDGKKKSSEAGATGLYWRFALGRTTIMSYATRRYKCGRS